MPTMDPEILTVNSLLSSPQNKDANELIVKKMVPPDPYVLVRSGEWMWFLWKQNGRHWNFVLNNSTCFGVVGGHSLIPAILAQGQVAHHTLHLWRFNSLFWLGNVPPRACPGHRICRPSVRFELAEHSLRWKMRFGLHLCSRLGTLGTTTGSWGRSHPRLWPQQWKEPLFPMGNNSRWSRPRSWGWSTDWRGDGFTWTLDSTCNCGWTRTLGKIKRGRCLLHPMCPRRWRWVCQSGRWSTPQSWTRETSRSSPYPPRRRSRRGWRATSTSRGASLWNRRTQVWSRWQPFRRDLQLGLGPTRTSACSCPTAGRLIDLRSTGPTSPRRRVTWYERYLDPATSIRGGPATGFIGQPSWCSTPWRWLRAWRTRRTSRSWTGYMEEPGTSLWRRTIWPGQSTWSG